MDKKTILITSALAALTAASGCANSGKSAKASGSVRGSFTAGACWGVNECRGKGECATPTNGCAGSNSCKGKGWITISQADCIARGGTLK